MSSIAIIGGTGREGKGLALRFALAGHQVIIGSRDAARAGEAADQLRSLCPGVSVSGAANGDAAAQGECAILAMPYDGLRETATAVEHPLAGKVVLSVVAPLQVEAGAVRLVLAPEGSAGELAARLLPTSRVVSAFHHLSAGELMEVHRELEGDVIVCSNHPEAKEQIMRWAEDIPHLRGVDGGPLVNSRYSEGLTALLLSVNRRYHTRSAIRILGI